MKCSLDISNFLEEISTLSHSVVFLYFFALITELVIAGIKSCFCLQHGVDFNVLGILKEHPQMS